MKFPDVLNAQETSVVNPNGINVAFSQLRVLFLFQVQCKKFPVVSFFFEFLPIYQILISFKGKCLQ